MIIILSSLILFPLSYYYRSWLRAFILLLQETLSNFQKQYNQQPAQLSIVQGHTKQLVSFSAMLPRKFPTFTVLKMNLLANQLHMKSCVPAAAGQDELMILIEQLTGFINAVEHEKFYKLNPIQNHTLSKLVHAWNYLCSKV